MTNRLGGNRPGPVGLYHPEQEHDACGVSFVCDLYGRATHDLVRKGLTSLCNLDHRGATGAEVNTGDGAGILTQIPDAFFRTVLPFDLPERGRYAAGIGFLPSDADAADAAAASIEKICAEEGAEVLGWRNVPIDSSMIGDTARAAMPTFRQLFLADAVGDRSGIDLDRLAFVIRKRVEHEVLDAEGGASVYFPSLSSRTIVYKGMLTTPQLGEFFDDLSDDRYESALALVHSRFSTNTFPSWPLAHPYRYVAHNGEINTVQGNQNWMRAREALLASDKFGNGDLERMFPICTPGSSDTARLDEVLELLHLGGYSLPHAMLMMIPEAWERHADMDPAVRDFYRFHACIMEPWDGPASVTFTDGTSVGAVLDRNGLRPSRYWVTDDDLVALTELAELAADALATAVAVGSSVLGTLISFQINAATGPAIVLIQATLFVVALLFAPRGGLLRRRAA